jgi:hypothetical protein
MTTTTTQPTVKEDTINLFKLGTLVNLKVSTWSGRKALTRADIMDVGLDPDGLPESIVNLGSKFLVPKTELQALNHLEQKARKYLDKWSVAFGISNAHFVPAKMLPSVEQELSEVKKEFFEAVDSFVSRFGQMRDAVKEQHPEFWEKCLKNCYPKTPQLLRDKFKFNWFMFKVSGMDVQETDLNEAMASEQVKQERVNELRSQMQKEVSGFVEDYAKTMRAETIKFCDLMTARVNEQPFGDEDEPKKLTGRSIDMFRRYADRFRNMNIFGYNEVEKMLNECLSEIRKKAADEGDFVDDLTRRIIL